MKKIHNIQKIRKKEINYNTFNNNLASHEINVKELIKNIYRFKHVYTLAQIRSSKSNFTDEKKLFDDYFVYKALDELYQTENDFNNFRDTIYDKYSNSGYLIHRDKYYIFQPFDENEDVPMYYREIQ